MDLQYIIEISFDYSINLLHIKRRKNLSCVVIAQTHAMHYPSDMSLNYLFEKVKAEEMNNRPNPS